MAGRCNPEVTWTEAGLVSSLDTPSPLVSLWRSFPRGQASLRSVDDHRSPRRAGYSSPGRGRTATGCGAGGASGRTRNLATAAETLARLTDDTSDSTRRWIVAAQADGREAEQEARAPGLALKIGPLVFVLTPSVRALLVGQGAKLSASGRTRTEKSLRRNDGLRRGQVAADTIGAFVGIRRASTSRRSCGKLRRHCRG